MRINSLGRTIGRTLGKGYRATVGGASGTGGLGYGRRSQGGIDARAEAGALIDSSVVYPVVSFAVKEMAKVPVLVVDGSGKEVGASHPLRTLVEAVNPWYGVDDLKSATVVAAMLAGNAYALKHRSPAGRLRGLEHLPLGACHPESLPRSGMFVDRYRVSVAAGHFAVGPNEVLHTRWFVPDPWFLALGFPPLAAVYPAIAADNRAHRYESAILRNQHKMHLLAPQGKDAENKPVVWGEPQRRELRAVMNSLGSEDAAGDLAVMPYPMSALQIGFSPQDMALEHVHDLSEERVCAVFNVPPVVVGFGAGLEAQNNRASYQAALVQAILAFVAPLCEHLGRQWTEDLVPELGQPGDRIVFDVERHPVMREYRAQSGSLAVGGPWISVNEQREIEGRPPVPGGEVIRGLPSQEPPSEGPTDPAE